MIYYSTGVATAKESQIIPMSFFKQMAEAKDFLTMNNLFASSYLGLKYPDKNIGEIVYEETKSLYEFVNNYSPNDEVKKFFLGSLDFDNLNVICKYSFLNSHSKICLIDGCEKVENLILAVKSRNFSLIKNKYLIDVLEKFFSLSSSATLSQIDFMIKKAKYEYLKNACTKSQMKDYVMYLIDLQNLSFIITKNDDQVEFLDGGHLSKKILLQILEGKEILPDKIDPNLLYFVNLTLKKKSQKIDADFDRARNNFMLQLANQKKYEVGNLSAFLCYIFKKQNELKNLSLIFSCKKNNVEERLLSSLLEV